MFSADFAIKMRDGLARIGEFSTPHGKVSTPSLMPVLDPINPNVLPIIDIKKLGAEIFITNAYLLYKRENIREKVRESGIHTYLGYNGPLMTDSGAFQLMSYGSVNVTNKAITHFQEEIGVDIGVFLDIPVDSNSITELDNAVNTTIERAKEHITLRNPNKQTMWVGPLQGGKNFEAFDRCCNFMTQEPFEIHAIGSIVPLMEAYDYSTVVNLILHAKTIINPGRPIHLFGAGHPMIFALACYLGVDLFDSAAYILFAKDRRYMTVQGTFNLEDLEYFPCFCKFCQNTNPKEIKSLEKDVQTQFLAGHNIAVSFGELNTIKQAIKDGRLYNLVLSRIQAHPRLAEAVSILNKPPIIAQLEQTCSLSYNKARFYSHPWAISDPLIARYHRRLIERYVPLRRVAVVRPPGLTLPSDCSVQGFQLNDYFGIIPDVWLPIYPLIQHESYNIEKNETTLSFIVETFFRKYKEYFDSIIALGLSIPPKWGTIGNLEDLPHGNPIRLDEQIVSILGYQYAVSNPLELLPLNVEISKKTHHIRSFNKNNELWGTIRAPDGLIIPQFPLLHWLHEQLSFPLSRVVIDKDSIPFVQEGKSVFCKFVLEIDPALRIGDEVLIVSEDDELIGTGTLQYPPQEIKKFKKGVAVKTRHRTE